LYEKVLGFKDLEDFMVNFWEAWALSKGKSAGAPVSTSLPLRERERGREGERKRKKSLPLLFHASPLSIRTHNSLTDDATDPENMLTMLHTWQTGDVSKQEPYNGDFSAAMKGIKAKTLVLPCKTDLYFREFCDL
jgi:hypothetical protein